MVLQKYLPPYHHFAAYVIISCIILKHNEQLTGKTTKEKFQQVSVKKIDKYENTFYKSAIYLQSLCFT